MSRNTPSQAYGMLLYHHVQAHGPKLRCNALAPLHLRRINTRPVSYYALFEGMAASKPTSWLSMYLHFLFHLALTLGP